MRRKLLYLAGQLGLMLQLRFFFQWILDFSNYRVDNQALLGASSIGFTLLMFRLFDAISDPIAGFLSDILLKKGFKRTFLMKVSAPFISIGLILIFSAKHSFDPLHNWLVVIAGLFVFFIGYTFYCIPYWALVDDLGQNDRGLKYQLSSSLGLGVFLATAIGFVATPFLVESLDFQYSAIFIAVFTLPLLYFPTFIDIASPIVTNSPVVFNPRLVFKNLMLPLKNREFVKTITQLGSVQMAFTALTSLAPMFVVEVLNREKGYIAFIMGPVILVALGSFCLLPRFFQKFTWEQILLSSVFLISLLFILVFPISVFSSGSSIPYIVLFGFLGMPMAAVLGIEALAVTNVMNENDEAGIYFGAFNFIIKALNGVAIMVAGYAIELSFSHNNPNIILWTLTGFGMLVSTMVFVSTKIVSDRNLSKI